MLLSYILIILLICFTTLIAYVSGASTTHNDIGFGATLVLLVFIILGLMIIHDEVTETTYKEGYKDGQIQAIIGNQHFHREVQPDSTVIWVSIN